MGWLSKLAVAGVGLGGLGLGVIALIIIGILVIGIVAALIIGFMVGGMVGAPKDLGVKWTEADYLSGMAKLPGHTTVNGAKACLFNCTKISTGSIPVDNSFTQEEFTASINKKLASGVDPLKNAQVKFNKDGTVEASAYAAALNAPVYVKGAIDSFTSRSVNLRLDKAEVAGVGVGADQLQQAQDMANSYINQYIAQTPGISIEDIRIEDGKLKFKGTFPALTQYL